MSTVTISVTEAMLMTALRAVLLALIPGAAVIQGYQNRVAMPTGATLVMTSLSTPPLSMTDEPLSLWAPGSVNPGAVGSTRSEEWVCQLDFFGTGAAESARLVNILVRSIYAANAFAALSPAPLAPLYAEPAQQATFINSENQYEPRWHFDFHAQYNPVVTTDQDFANELAVKLAEVDTTFPPES